MVRLVFDPRELATMALIAMCFFGLRSTPLRAEPAPSAIVVAVPFSGTVHTNAEDISVSGTLHIQMDLDQTQKTVFTRLHTNLSDTKGTGLTSGQDFVGVGAPLTMCFFPIGDVTASSIVFEQTSGFRLIATGRLAPFYSSGRPETTLVLVPSITVTPAGTLIDATVIVNSNRVGVTLALLH
jgi:hypothetical protein